jgi:hypothetical protein
MLSLTVLLTSMAIAHSGATVWNGVYELRAEFVDVASRLVSACVSIGN